MKSDPCSVCGNTDLNLIDGFYYCVECGTQDVNVQETIIEQTFLPDGTIAFVGRKKFSTVIKDGIEMSGEWHKWHAYNFILAGLTDELISLGAKPSVKLKVLWIWTRYVKHFQIKEDLELTRSKEGEGFNLSSQTKTDTSESEGGEYDVIQHNKKAIKPEKFSRDIKKLTKGSLLAILYIALNLDRSDIQLTHLFRFIKEGRLNILNCTKYVPKEIDTKSIPGWKSFIHCQSEYTPHSIRAFAMTLLKILDLGIPLVPNLKKIIDNYIRELCLPIHFKNLVLSIMLHYPCDFLDINSSSKRSMVRIPDYEGVCMSYVLVALKMCFGLDDDYEWRMSASVDKINSENNYLKSYKLGMFSEPTDRLFSFCEWVQYLQFRKTVLCQHYLPMARQHKLHINDYVLMEHLEERNKQPIKLRHEVTMDILSKIPIANDITVVPKTEFMPSLTPFSTYSEVIVNYIIDHDLKLLMSEDFSQYSLKYATENLILSDIQNESDNLIVGVSLVNKTFAPASLGSFDSKEGDMTIVYIRNCENKNWLKMNPPSSEHIKIIKNVCSDKESDHGYDSNIENTLLDSDENCAQKQSFEGEELNEKFETFDEEYENSNIFDDVLDDLNESKSIVEQELSNNFYNESLNNSRIDVLSNDNYESSIHADHKFNAKTFNRNEIIHQLIALACKKYNISMPKEKIPQKRRSNLIRFETGDNLPKRQRTLKSHQGSTQVTVNEVIAAYYENLKNDVMVKVAENVKTAIEASHLHQESNVSDQFNFVSSELENINHDQNSTFNSPKNIDQSVNSVEIRDLEAESSLNKIGNKEVLQLEDIYDTKQLYIKWKEDVNIDDFFKIHDDPEVAKLLDTKIEEFRNNDVCKIPVKQKEIAVASSDSEDEIPLEDILNEEKFKRKRNKIKQYLDPLIRNPLNIKNFKYWLRHYSCRSISRNLDMHEKFDLELKEHFPASFHFVINECAAVLDCSTFNLYKWMQILEELLIDN